MSTRQLYCRTCEEPIQWARTAAGKNIPLDMEPVDPDTAGAQVTIRRAGKLQARPLDVAVEEIAAAEQVSSQRARDLVLAWVYPAYVSHFATCDQADQWRTRHPKRKGV